MNNFGHIAIAGPLYAGKISPVWRLAETFEPSLLLESGISPGQIASRGIAFERFIGLTCLQWLPEACARFFYSHGFSPVIVNADNIDRVHNERGL